VKTVILLAYILAAMFLSVRAEVIQRENYAIEKYDREHSHLTLWRFVPELKPEGYDYESIAFPSSYPSQKLQRWFSLWQTHWSATVADREFISEATIHRERRARGRQVRVALIAQQVQRLNQPAILKYEILLNLTSGKKLKEVVDACAEKGCKTTFAAVKQIRYRILKTVPEIA
jgi:hypothetical protein